MRVVKVRRIDKDPVGQGRQRCIGSVATGAPDLGHRRGLERFDKPADKVAFFRIVTPRTQAATDRVENDVAGLLDDLTGQVFKTKVTHESAQLFGGTRIW